MATKICAISLNTFGTYYVTDAYLLKGLTKRDAEDHQSQLLLIANIISLISVLFLGYVSDKIQSNQLWKLLSIVNIVTIIFYSLMMVDMSVHHYQDFSSMYDIGLVGAASMHTLTFVLYMIILSKVCNKQTRGTIFAVNGFISSTGVMIFQGAAGALYT